MCGIGQFYYFCLSSLTSSPGEEGQGGDSRVQKRRLKQQRKNKTTIFNRLRLICKIWRNTNNLFHNANSKLFEFSKALRKNQTETEKIIWHCLRNRKLLNLDGNLHYINVLHIFYYHEAKLIIEINGGIYNNPENQEYDQNRTIELMKIGITVIRFANEEVNNSLNRVINAIKSYLSP